MSYAQHAPYYKDLLACTRCEIRKEASRVVGGVGPLDARILLLGQNPGENEDKRGEPFIGRGGDELNTWLTALRLSRAHLALTNVVKCHTEKNRPPKNKEVIFCRNQWLGVELDVWARVDVVMPLGKPALFGVIGTGLKPPGAMEPWWTRVKYGQRTLLVIPLPHPAYILRAPNLRAELQRDFLPVVAETLTREAPEAYAYSRG